MDWWEDAARSLETASAGTPPNPHALALLAMVRLRNEDRAGYRKACGQLLSAEMPEDDYRENLACWACVLGAETLPQSEQVLNRAKRLANQYPKVADHPLVYGAALMRAGRLEKAVQQLEKVGPKSIPATLLLGITRIRQGRLQQGTNYLAKADDLLASLKSTGAPSLAQNRWRQSHWSERLRIEVLRRELRTLIDDSSTRPLR